jgi:hypothetical protein
MQNSLWGFPGFLSKNQLISNTAETAVHERLGVKVMHIKMWLVFKKAFLYVFYGMVPTIYL